MNSGAEKATDKLKNEIKQDVRDAIDSLRTLRDELRVQVHLGGMEARAQLETLEHDFEKLQSAAKQATHSSVKALTDAYLELKASLKRESDKVARARPRQ